MAGPVWTQADIDALTRAIASGTLEVQFSDRSVRYQSLKDMLALLALMTASANPDARSFRLAAHDKGL
jgi:hypothetical protein